MYMSVVDSDPGVAVYPELAGLRVLVTGLSAAAGVDIARAFAEHGCRMVLQAQEQSPEITAIGELLAQCAGDIRMFAEPIDAGEQAVRFAQTAAKAFGGLEVVINLVPFTAEDLATTGSVDAIESVISNRLLPMTLLTRVVANRMRLIMTEGLVLNVVLMPEPKTSREAAMAALVRSAVAALTRGEAQAWAGEALRINAVAPAADGKSGSLASEPSIAALALHLASRRGKRLSGLVFDAAGMMP